MQNPSVSTDLFPRANSLPSRLRPHETIRCVTVKPVHFSYKKSRRVLIWLNPSACVFAPWLLTLTAGLRLPHLPFLPPAFAFQISALLVTKNNGHPPPKALILWCINERTPRRWDRSFPCLVDSVMDRQCGGSFVSTLSLIYEQTPVLGP